MDYETFEKRENRKRKNLEEMRTVAEYLKLAARHLYIIGTSDCLHFAAEIEKILSHDHHELWSTTSY